MSNCKPQRCWRKNCKRCNNLFETRRKRHKICPKCRKYHTRTCKKCYKLFQAKYQSKICLICKNKFKSKGFKRIKTVHHKNGCSYSYKYIVKSYKNKGHVKQKIIKYLGKAKNYEPFNRKEVFDIKGRICKICGNTSNLVVDHIVPTSKGGKNNIENLQVLCQICNCKKGKKLI